MVAAPAKTTLLHPVVGRFTTGQTIRVVQPADRMQHFGQNKELGVPPVNIFGSCHENRNVAYSKFLGVNDKNVHGSIERISINV